MEFCLGTMLWIAACVPWPMAAQDAGPTLELQIANGQTEFHIGERIPLKLTFQSPSDSGFVIVPYASIDVHGGEFDMDAFEVTPSTGWADPLAMWLARERVITGKPAGPRLRLRAESE